MACCISINPLLLSLQNPGTLSAKKLLIVGLIAVVLFNGLLVAPAIADPASVDAAITNAQTSADTAFMLMSAALVLLMTPGLAFSMVVLSLDATF